MNINTCHPQEGENAIYNSFTDIISLFLIMKNNAVPTEMNISVDFYLQHHLRL